MAFQGDSVDPATGQQVYWPPPPPLPSWYGAAARQSINPSIVYEVPDPQPSPQRWIWTPDGFIPYVPWEITPEEGA